MGGKRFRWIYFQLGQLALLSVAAFVAALAVAIPVSGAPTRVHQALLQSAEMSVMLWIPSLALWLIVKRRNSRRRKDRYDRFAVLFVTTASIILTGFYGIFADAAVLKKHHPDFSVDFPWLLPLVAAAGVLGLYLGSALRNRAAFLALFAAMGIVSFDMLLVRGCLTDPATDWQHVGNAITARFILIGGIAFGIAAGIFVRELIRYRRRELRRRVT